MYFLNLPFRYSFFFFFHSFFFVAQLPITYPCFGWLHKLGSTERFHTDITAAILVF